MEQSNYYAIIDKQFEKLSKQVQKETAEPPSSPPEETQKDE